MEERSRKKIERGIEGKDIAEGREEGSATRHGSQIWWRYHGDQTRTDLIYGGDLAHDQTREYWGGEKMRR